MNWQLLRQRRTLLGVGVAAVLLWPGRSRVTTDFVLEPGTRAFVRADTFGWVDAIKVEEGQEVAAETVLAVLRNPELEARAEILARQLETEERALAAAQARGDIARLRQHWQHREQLRLGVADVQAHRAGLTLRAPVAGVVTTPRLAEQRGRFLAEGATFCELADRRTMRARVLVPDRDVEEIMAQIKAGKAVPAKLNVVAIGVPPFSSFQGRVEAVSPAAASDLPPGAEALPARRGASLYNYFAVELRFSNPGKELREGMKGTAKIYGGRLPLLLRTFRGIWRWARTLVW